MSMEAAALAQAGGTRVALSHGLSKATAARLIVALKNRPDLAANQGSWSEHQKSAWRRLSAHERLPHSIDVQSTAELAEYADSIDAMNIWLWENDLWLKFDQNFSVTEQQERPLQKRELQVSDGRRLCVFDEQALGTKVNSKHHWQTLEKRSRSAAGLPKSEIYRQMEQALRRWVQGLGEVAPVPLPSGAAAPAAALRKAARLGDLSVLRELLGDSPGSINEACSRDGFTALHSACRHGRLACVEALLNAGAQPTLLTKRGDSALHLAVWGANGTAREAGTNKANLSCARLLVQAAPELLHVRCADGETALDWSTRKGKPCKWAQQGPEGASSQPEQPQTGLTSRSTSRKRPMESQPEPSIEGDAEKYAECVMCLGDFETLQVLAPCGHQCVCKGCAQKVQKKTCPVCRAKVMCVVAKVYKV